MKIDLIRTTTLVAMFSLFCCGVLKADDDDQKDPSKLTIGSRAPSLDIEHWVQDGQGQFKPVTKFETGKVYVVEFWATWCGPCIASMPHLSELQARYGKRGLQIVSISDEELETVEKFLERNVRGDDQKTYAELTSNYCLTTDPDGSSQREYMRAAGQNGIPTAFIVGKEGRIEWIGHPMQMDQPLVQVLDGTWDREKFAADLKVKEWIETEMRSVYRLLQADKMDEALEKMEGLIAEAPEELKLPLAMNRFSLLVTHDDPRTAATLDQLASQYGDSPDILNQLSWSVVERSLAGEEVSPKLLRSARQAADKGVAKAPQDASLLDTQAHLAHLQGNLVEAIAIQEKAVAVARDPRMKTSLVEFLGQLKEERDQPSNPDDSKQSGNGID